MFVFCFIYYRLSCEVTFCCEVFLRNKLEKGILGPTATFTKTYPPTYIPEKYSTPFNILFFLLKKKLAIDLHAMIYPQTPTGEKPRSLSIQHAIALLVVNPPTRGGKTDGLKPPENYIPHTYS